jgi:hypothetical protein
VEGKALEPFGETVDRWLGNARPERAPSAGRVKRINFLAERLGLDPASIGDLRYQLLHRTVAALIEAERWKTSAAVMLVQRFSRRPTEQAASWTDFHNFALRLKADAQPNAFIRAEVPTEIPLYLAWLDCDVATDAEILAAALDRPLREAAPRRNAFEALCALASRESWCWRLGCTTCGCMHFRYGLMEMARGGHPDSPNWITRSRVRSTRLSERLGEMPGIPMPANVQKQVIAIASQSNLAKISSVSKFPDWLGYLGVILHFCSDAEAASRALTASWVTQLCRLLPAESQLEHRLTNLTEAGRVLSLADLESVESELLHSHVHV